MKRGTDGATVGGAPPASVTAGLALRAVALLSRRLVRLDDERRAEVRLRRQVQLVYGVAALLWAAVAVLSAARDGAWLLAVPALLGVAGASLAVSFVAVEVVRERRARQ